MDFFEEYPNKPPKCKFNPVLFHPNIYPCGTVCLSILDEDEDWKPSITIPELLKGIQELMDNPNSTNPVQCDAYLLYTQARDSYNDKVREQARSLSAPADKAAAGGKPAAKNQQINIKVKVKAQDGTHMQYIFKRTSQLKKIFDSYCQQKGLANNQQRFIFNGERIKDDDNPDSLEMENGDEIDVMVEQTGGSQGQGYFMEF